MEMTKRYMAWARRAAPKGQAGRRREADRRAACRHIKVEDGKPVASDGPYAEAKDVIGGYFMIEAKDARRSRGDRPGLPASRAGADQLGRAAADRGHGPGPRRRGLTVEHRSTGSSTRSPAIRRAGWSPPWRGGWARPHRRRRGCRPACAAAGAVARGRSRACRSRPEAWLATVARNRALDLLRSEARGVALAEELVPLAPASPAERDGRFDRELNDDELALLFAVCHPALSPRRASPLRSRPCAASPCRRSRPAC